jgi:hypothetical protein
MQGTECSGSERGFEVQNAGRGMQGAERGFMYIDLRLFAEVIGGI